MVEIFSSAGLPRPVPMALMMGLLYIDFYTHVISTGREKSVLAMKPGSWAFALDPKRDLSSQGSVEMTPLTELKRNDSQWDHAMAPNSLR